MYRIPNLLAVIVLGIASEDPPTIDTRRGAHFG